MKSYIKNNLRIVIPVIISIVIIIIGIIYINWDGSYENKLQNEATLEENLFNRTGMSKEDAIELVKPNFVNEVYVFSSEATNDNLYKVTATNTVSLDEKVYYVDPTTSKIYEDFD